MDSPTQSAAKRKLNYDKPYFVKKQEISELTGLSMDTLKRYRLSGILIKDIHWVRVNSKLVLYNAPLILDWLQNISNPKAHNRAIEAYLDTLLSNKKTKRGLSK